MYINLVKPVSASYSLFVVNTGGHVPKYAEGREKTERLVIPVTKAEHEFARNVTGEAGFAGKAREVLRAAGLLPALPRAAPTLHRICMKCGDPFQGPVEPTLPHCPRCAADCAECPPEAKPTKRAAKAKKGGK